MQLATYVITDYNFNISVAVLIYSLILYVFGLVSLFDGHMVAEGLLLQPIALLYLLHHHKALFHEKMQRNAIQHQFQNLFCGGISLKSFFSFYTVQLLHQKKKGLKDFMRRRIEFIFKKFYKAFFKIHIQVLYHDEGSGI